jgi:UTP--glucose-1-phosphate uridylyltransferase
VLCAERVVGNELIALLLADDFLTYSGNGIMSDLIGGYEKTGKSQLSVMKINGPYISKYCVIVTDNKKGLVKVIIENQILKVHHQIWEVLVDMSLHLLFLIY